MSYLEPQNPYASPQTPPLVAEPVGLAHKPIDRIEYFRAYQYIFESPNGTMNVVWGFLCTLSTAVIPVLGQLVFMGYQFEVVQGLLTSQGKRYPDFDINRFADYLGRSIWPFLVSLVLTIPIIIVFYIGMACVGLAVMAAAAVGGDDVGPVLGLLAGVLGFVGLVGLMAAVTCLMTPIMLRAGLQQDFAAGFNVAWIRGFLERTWREILLATLFLIGTSLVLMPLGLLALCVGLFAVTAVVMLAQAHLWYQLYVLYLSRGGEEIPLKPAPGPAPFPPR